MIFKITAINSDGKVMDEILINGKDGTTKKVYVLSLRDEGLLWRGFMFQPFAEIDDKADYYKRAGGNIGTDEANSA